MLTALRPVPNVRKRTFVDVAQAKLFIQKVSRATIDVTCRHDVSPEVRCGTTRCVSMFPSIPLLYPIGPDNDSKVSCVALGEFGKELSGLSIIPQVLVSSRLRREVVTVWLKDEIIKSLAVSSCSKFFQAAKIFGDT